MCVSKFILAKKEFGVMGTLNLGFNLERLFCSSQAKTNFIGFPTKKKLFKVFKARKPNVAITFDKLCAQSNFLICPAPYPRDKTRFKQIPTTGQKRAGLVPGVARGKGMVTGGIESRTRICQVFVSLLARLPKTAKNGLISE